MQTVIQPTEDTLRDPEVKTVTCAWQRGKGNMASGGFTRKESLLALVLGYRELRAT